MKFRYIHFYVLLACLLALVGCSDGDDIQVPARQLIAPVEYTFAHNDLAANDPAQIPLPNDIGLRNPVTGQLEIPSTGDPNVDGLIAQINTLKGYSTTGPLRIPFVGLVDHSTVTNQTILVVDLNDLQAAQAGVTVNPFRTMRFSVNDVDGNSVVTAYPVLPLKPAHSHLVIITENVIGSGTGTSVESEQITIGLKSQIPLEGDAAILEPVRQALAPLWEAAESITGRERLFIPLIFTFTTQPLLETLPVLRERAVAANPTPNINTAFVGAEAVDSFFQIAGQSFVPHSNIGAMYFGTFNAPQYRDETGVIHGSGNDVVQTGTEDIPFVVSLPAGTGPFPTLIFQHGITGSKDHVLALADTANFLGVGIIAIDLVLHGERTYGIDLQNNETGLPVPDGIPDSSGANFINLANILVSRDNIRQSTADLFALTQMITSGNTDFNGDGQPELVSLAPAFMGMSLGGIVGASFVSNEPAVTTAVLNATGGGIIELLQNSETFGPRILGGLSLFGITPGSSLYDLYTLIASAIIDDADPLNYAAHFSTGSLAGGAVSNVLLQEILDDDVIPNFSTANLALTAGFDQIDAITAIDGLNQTASPATGSGLFQFIGGHGSLIDPSSGVDITIALQTQAFNYLFSALQNPTGLPVIINPAAGAGKLSMPINQEGPWLELFPHFYLPFQ